MHRIERFARSMGWLGMAVALPLAADTSRPAAPDRLPPGAQAAISATLGRDDLQYHVVARDGSLHLRNAGHGLGVEFRRGSVDVESPAGRVELRFLGYGYGDTRRGGRAVAPHATANRVEYRRGALTEWYINGPVGLEHGFTLSEPPKPHRGGPLTLSLGVAGDLSPSIDSGGKTIHLARTTGTPDLAYGGLVATDASGRELESRMEVRGREILLHVDDRDADYPIVVDPFLQLAKLTESVGMAGDAFGGRLAVSGDTVVVSAYQWTFNRPFDSGRAFVFVKPAGGWTAATESAQLICTTSSQILSVAVDGDVVVAGPFDGSATACVFVKPAGGWTTMTETAHLTPADASSAGRFGIAAAIDGDTIAIAADSADVGTNFGQGAIYVFVEPAGGWADMTETAKLTTTDGPSVFGLGWSVAIDGDTIVAGAPAATIEGHDGQGAAYVFTKPSGGWVTAGQTARLTAPDGEGFDSLGYDVAVDGETIVVGAGADDIAAAVDQGSAYVFRKPVSGWATTSDFDAKLTASDGAAFDSFGTSVAVRAETALVGAFGDDQARGSAYVFTELPSGWATTSTFGMKLTAADRGQNNAFGEVALDGTTAAVGANRAGPAPFPGAAYVFTVVCDDGNPCTDDSLDSGSCLHAPATGTPCDDGNVCTAGDTCSAGVCASGAPASGACDDGDPCTTGDSCSAGACVSGPPALSYFRSGVEFRSGFGPIWLATSDFDGDGPADLAVATISSPNAWVYLGTGDGSFEPFGSADYVTTSARSVTVGRFDAGSTADFAVANGTTNNVSVLLGNGDGTFAVAGTFAAGTGPRSVTTDEFNGDAKADLAVADFTTNAVSVLLGNGDGSFQAPVGYPTGSGPFHVISRDLNHDARADLVVSNSSSTTVSVLLGNGNGTFQTAVNYAAGSSPRATGVGLFNADAHPDLAVANFGSQSVSLLLGNGDGTFQAAVNYGVGVNPRDVAVADFDADGRTDLAVVNQGSQSVSLLLGNGNGTFQPAVNYSRGSSPSGLAVGDFNGDSAPDLAVAVQGSSNNSVSVLLNTSCSTCMAHCDECTSPDTCTTCSAGYVFDSGTSSCVPDLCFGVTCTAADSCHDVGVCNPSTGICSDPPSPNGTVCSDANACTTVDTCQSGTCTGSDYAWSGVLQPINADGSSIFKLGSTIPVKFQLVGACSGLEGLNAHLFLAKLSNSILGTEVEATSTSAADTGNTFRYAGNDQYIFNLATQGLSKGTWILRIDLGDGVPNRTVTISLK